MEKITGEERAREKVPTAGAYAACAAAGENPDCGRGTVGVQAAAASGESAAALAANASGESGRSADAAPVFAAAPAAAVSSSSAAGGASAPLLEVRDLRVAFKARGGEALAVRGVTFEVRAGETVALVGESGCGKSVTAKSVMGLVRRPGRVLPGSEVRFDGQDVLGFSRRRWDAFRGRDCAMVFQDALASLNPTMRVGAQLTEALDNHCPQMSRAEKLARAEEALSQTGIPDARDCMRRYPHELSGGMRQRVMIASAMVCRPRLLIADEPTTSLDVTVQAQTLELMGQMQRQTGCAVLLVTHDMGLVADFASRVVVMYAGRVVEQGGVEDIFYRPSHPYTRALLASVPRLDAPIKQGFSSIEGAPPDPARMPAGCAFAPRCPYAMNVCAQTEPEVYEVGGEGEGSARIAEETGRSANAGDATHRRAAPAHEAACWLCDPRCPHAMNVCAQAGPEVYEVGGEGAGSARAAGDAAQRCAAPAHEAACWLCDSRCPAGDDRIAGSCGATSGAEGPVCATAPVDGVLRAVRNEGPDDSLNASGDGAVRSDEGLKPACNDAPADSANVAAHAPSAPAPREESC